MSSNGLPTTLPPGASETTLSFPNPKNEILVGTFVDAPSPNVVVLCHGYTANKDMCQYGPLAASLAARGYSSFRFDHPCAWRGASERHGPFLMGNHDDEVADIAAAVGFMREQGKNVVCVLGHSKGGTNIIQYAAQIGDVPKIINLSGRFCVLEGVKQRFGADILERLAETPEGIMRVETRGNFEWLMTLEDFKHRVELPMDGFAAAIKAAGRVQMLCLHGLQDVTIPWQESQRCAELSGSELVLIDGDHNFTKAQDAREMIAQVLAFLEK